MSGAVPSLGVALLVLGGAAAPVLQDPVSLSVEVASEQVESGRAFPLVVERRWREDLQPEAWDARLLAPLVLKPAGREARREDGFESETLRFLAYAFPVGELRFEELRFRARPATEVEGGEVQAVAPPFRLEVRSALGEGEAGPPEFPDGPLAPPASGGSLRWWLLLPPLALLWWWWAQARRRAPRSSPRSAPLTTASRARLARETITALQSRRTDELADSAAYDADAVELAATLRGYLEAGLGLACRPLTSEELAPALSASGGAQRVEDLAAFLSYCDREKFGPSAALRAARAQAIDQAIGFVEANA